ncbi:MAG: ATP-binding protein [Lachnospiraceae bacterium]|nr:ATP-binding protein [Lachnospiraceae bacterium]
MKPVNIFALTRVSGKENLKRLERQLSERERFLNVKEWETDGLKSLVSNLLMHTNDVCLFDFFYSFQIPKLGKEFDLLRISDEYILNLELKSEKVSENAIKKQLTLNRYYLEMLGKGIKSYTYISSQNRLLRLTNSGRLVDADWEELCEDLKGQESLYDGDIEELFKEVEYLISPMTRPDRFLRHEYFLTLQQKDIEGCLFRNIVEEKVRFQGYKGLPGTGKTLLLYDLAMLLSETKRVCLIHCGAFPKELSLLNERLKRVDFMTPSGFLKAGDDVYSYILIDEGHLLGKRAFDRVREVSEKCDIPVVISYDTEEFIAKEERLNTMADEIEAIPEIVLYRLTNRIRTNNELSSFIRCLFRINGDHAHRRHYPSVTPVYAGTKEDLQILGRIFKDKGFVSLDPDTEGTLGIEHEKVLSVIDCSYYYDDEGYLRGKVRTLYQTLSRAKREIAVIVYENEEVFDRILKIVQARD